MCGKLARLYNNSGKSRAEVISEFAAQSGYKDESASADELLTIARRNRSIASLYRTEQDEGGEETGEDVTRDDSWNYAEILWNGIQAKQSRRHLSSYPIKSNGIWKSGTPSV